ncbi:MAG: molybdopterin synthase catalytic subunit MoaE [Candidatus Thiodiazotropha sp.]
MDSVSIRAEPFDPNREVELLRGNDPSIGALVTFIGLMRDINEGDRIERLYLEHYPGMTERALQEIVDEANSRWDIQHCRVVHRVGALLPTDPIVLVAVASRHRKEAFRACEFIIDYLKTRAPFWKKETTAEGERWVDARVSDDAATLAWEKSDI